MAFDQCDPGCGAGACWHCTVYGGLDSRRTNAVCWHDAPAVHIRSLAQNGCVHFVRMPGVDDETAPPKEFSGGDHAGWRRGQAMGHPSLSLCCTWF